MGLGARQWLVWGVVLLAGAGRVFGQAPADAFSCVPEPVQQEHILVRALIPLLIPKLMADTYELRDYIRSPVFAGIRRACGDRIAVDVLFRRASRMEWGNPFGAILVTMMATMDHRRFGLDLPLVGALLWFPLTAEFEEEFDERVAALPALIVPDSPRGGDRDKLQHFFGAALLVVTFESADVVDRMNTFIEWGEEGIVVGGAADPRDVAAGMMGAAFGTRLLEHPDTLPSEFLQMPLSSVPGTSRAIPEEVR